MHFQKLMYYFIPSEGIYEKGGVRKRFAFFIFMDNNIKQKIQGFIVDYSLHSRANKIIGT